MAKSFKTFLKHTAKDYHNQSVNPPVVRASTIIFKSMNDIRRTQAKYKRDPRGGYFDYGRQGTSTTHMGTSLPGTLSKFEPSAPAPFIHSSKALSAPRGPHEPLRGPGALGAGALRFARNRQSCKVGELGTGWGQSGLVMGSLPL